PVHQAPGRANRLQKRRCASARSDRTANGAKSYERRSMTFEDPLTRTLGCPGSLRLAAADSDLPSGPKVVRSISERGSFFVHEIWPRFTLLCLIIRRGLT